MSKALERMTVVGDDEITNDWSMVDQNAQEVDVHGDVQTDQIYDCKKESLRLPGLHAVV